MYTAYKFAKQKYAHQAKYKHEIYQAANENFHMLCNSELCTFMIKRRGTSHPMIGNKRLS
jgi:hypothetical protein